MYRPRSGRTIPLESGRTAAGAERARNTVHAPRTVVASRQHLKRKCPAPNVSPPSPQPRKRVGVSETIFGGIFSHSGRKKGTLSQEADQASVGAAIAACGAPTRQQSAPVCVHSLLERFDSFWHLLVWGFLCGSHRVHLRCAARCSQRCLARPSSMCDAARLGADDTGLHRRTAFWRPRPRPGLPFRA